MTDKEKIIKIDKAAKEVLNLARNTLFMDMRFMQNALFRFNFEIYPGTVSNDARTLFYNPIWILQRFKYNKEIITHDYLHMVLHCVFRHSFVGETINRNIWNLACDIAVESMISEIAPELFNIVNKSEKQEEISRLQGRINLLSAEKIYAEYKNENLSKSELKKLSKIFKTDDHSTWYPETKNQALNNNSNNNNNNSDSNSSKKNSNQKDNLDKNKKQDNNQNQQSNNNQKNKNRETEQNFGNEFDNQSREELKREWEDVSNKLQTDLETFSKEIGDSAGGTIQQLKALNREKVDYSSFLKKFATIHEIMKVDLDSFDYGFYCYGLSLYKNVALIEPPEYKEAKLIKEFVIAIDTSGSVSGDLVQQFVQKTYDILKSTETFTSRMNLHIIQCDAKIQEDVKITSQNEFDEYIKNMQIKGFCGTDFNPVFRYIDKMQKNHEFTNLKGMIYFSDGYGDFPKHKPDYKVAFVFLDDEYGIPDVPPWVIRITLSKDDIEEIKE